MSATSASWFSDQLFMPHGHCYLWEPALVWVQVLSNGAIAAAYVAIFLTLVYLVRRIKDIPFQWMYVAFAVFIVACGVTHIFDVVVIWKPAYWEDGALRMLTALASVGTALMLPPLVPKAIAIADAAAVAHQRGMKLEEANRELATLLGKTQELEQLKTRFFANVSHELRTPLALVLGPIDELMKADNLRDDQRKTLTVVQRNARTLLAHVNDLLDVAKLEADKLEADYTEIDLAALVRDITDHFHALATERGIMLEVRAPAALRVEVDPNKLERVLVNLLSNAFKFTPQGGAVQCRLTVDEAHERFHLEVADSGPGIAEVHRKKVFERFHQLDGGINRRFGGTGLGLAIVKEFVELHGGSVDVHQSELGGALLRAELPLRAPKDKPVKRASVATRHEPNVATLAASATSSNVPELAANDDATSELPRVLIAEDNVDLNHFIVEALSSDARVTAANNGAQALRLAREQQPDLIVTDLMMPDMSGDELLRAVRADAELGETPVMILTAKADDQLRVQLLREGAHDYILKPFAADELRVRAQKLVAMKRARDLLRAELTTKSGDVEQLARELTRRGRELQTAIDSLRVANEQALAASAAKTRFLATVSHELRTPITTLRLQVDRLQRGTVPFESERYQRVIGRIDNSSLRLQQLVESLLDFSRVQSGHLDVRIEQTNLTELTYAAVDEMRPQIEQKNLSITVESPPDERVPTWTDPKLFRLILINLLANAMKFTEQGGLRVRIEHDPSHRRVSVHDTGIGIAEADQKRIFDAFEQVGTIEHKHAGVGLGLAIVHELAATLGASIRVTSELGKGSVFTLELPIAADQPDKVSYLAAKAHLVV